MSKPKTSGSALGRFMNLSESINSQGPVYNADEVQQTQTKFLDTKAENQPTYFEFEDDPEHKILKAKKPNSISNFKGDIAINDKIEKERSARKRMKTIRVESSVPSSVSKSKFEEKQSYNPSHDDFDFSSKPDEPEESVKEKKSTVESKKNDELKAKKAKEAKEDRKAQILAEIMKYEKIDENAVKMKKVKRPFYCIDPLSNFHLIHCLSVLVNIFIIIIWISFESSYNDEFSFVIHIVYIVNIFDVALTGLTGVLNRDNQVDYSLLFIWKNYITSYFILDFFCAIPFDWFISKMRHQRTMRLFQTTKAFKYFYFSIILDGTLLKARIQPGTIRFLKIIFNLLSIVQVFSCSFHILHYYNVEDENWLRNGSFSDDDTLQKYMLSLFWTLQTITTVGYGTITLTNSLEKLYAIIVIIIGATIYSFIVGSISSSVHNNEEKSIKLQDKLKVLKEMGTFGNLPDELLKRIERFLKENITINGVASGTSRIPLQKCLSELPERLKIELIQYTHRDIIRKNSFFFGKPLEFALNVLSIQREITVPSDYMMYKRGDPAEEVFIIYSGSIVLYSEDWIPYVKYSAGSYFGEIEVLFKEEGAHKDYHNRSLYAYTENGAVFGVITREQLSKIFKDFKQEEEDFRQIAKERKRCIAERAHLFAHDADLSPDLIEKRDRELKFGEGRRKKLMDKFGSYISYRQFIENKYTKDSLKGADSKTKKLLTKENLVKPEDEIINPDPVPLIGEGAKDTVLDVIDSDKDIEELDYDQDVTISTTHSNAQLINDVLEVRKQVEKFKELLDASSHLIQKQ
ncbi:unnamed protein product [Moneuplotes crassus]|uniref:Cyclic nucleotide-binding domain-containing protein n=1 Tax=Euplotes crassus TaxID=5936 RepID=A0AAD1Y6R8_EUPCR|nr:unnamed protein product [Moneuplotes crassus]